MSNKELLKRFSLSSEELDRVVAQAMGTLGHDQIDDLYEGSVKNFTPDALIDGTVQRIVNDDVMVDIGFKAEGLVPLYEFDGVDPEIGSQVEVMIEGLDENQSLYLLSMRKATRLRGWEKIVQDHGEGDLIEGTAIRKIKGGLLLDVDGVPVFLPASQLDIRRVPDVSTFIGRVVQCKIIKIDRERMNIVVSRRKLLEEQRQSLRDEVLGTLEEGQIREGLVKNIADFGAFVDIGGVDGLLHITDMSWGRVNHPSEVVQIEQKLQVKVLRFDKERGRIALGLKQLEASPWDEIEGRYAVGERVTGEVVNIMPYGAFVKLEDGIEGLVHISEMSWTKRINHPSEMVDIGDQLGVVVLEIHKEKQEISLGIKQTEVNPWTEVEERYPIGTIIEGNVRNLTNYGAFIEIEEGIDGLLHVSDMSWTKKVAHPSEVLEKGEAIRAVVLSVNTDKRRVALGSKQLEQDPWQDEIPRRFGPGDIVVGRVCKFTNFGVFVLLDDGLEGLLHISEMSEEPVDNAEDAVDIDQLVDVRVLKVDSEERKIGLSMIGVPQHSYLTDDKKKDAVEAESSEEASDAEAGDSDASEVSPAEVSDGVGGEDDSHEDAVDDGADASETLEANVEEAQESSEEGSGDSLEEAPSIENDEEGSGTIADESTQESTEELAGGEVGPPEETGEESEEARPEAEETLEGDDPSVEEPEGSNDESVGSESPQVGDPDESSRLDE
ncbi:MAG: 30S ribosomal protein S1 [Planctomycetota bacterium]|nr:30S ribosomal protein S1 [Planctomycetota bacterium]